MASAHSVLPPRQRQLHCSRLDALAEPELYAKASRGASSRRARRLSAVTTKPIPAVAAFWSELPQFFSCVHAFLRYFPAKRRIHLHVFDPSYLYVLRATSRLEASAESLYRLSKTAGCNLRPRQNSPCFHS